ncbi:hypothetical protein A2U01_0048100 [Trifolium medium]|uniref:Uncharacterized protein n=1 Tax=Trifolium medium TaxID=97028 RepID=A0A392QSR0_9FABA|nr:hypothetical protein [Trifolium medium]
MYQGPTLAAQALQIQLNKAPSRKLPSYAKHNRHDSYCAPPTGDAFLLCSRNRWIHFNGLHQSNASSCQLTLMIITVSPIYRKALAPRYFFIHDTLYLNVIANVTTLDLTIRIT